MDLNSSESFADRNYKYHIQYLQHEKLMLAFTTQSVSTRGASSTLTVDVAVTLTPVPSQYTAHLINVGYIHIGDWYVIRQTNAHTRTHTTWRRNVIQCAQYLPQTLGFRAL